MAGPSKEGRADSPGKWWSSEIEEDHLVPSNSWSTSSHPSRCPAIPPPANLPVCDRIRDRFAPGRYFTVRRPSLDRELDAEGRCPYGTEKLGRYHLRHRQRAA